MLDAIRRFAQREPVIIANALALITALLTWLISDSAIVTMIVALLTAIVGTGAARANVWNKPHHKAAVRKARTAAYEQGVHEAMAGTPDAQL